jgi:hypothetical protein
MHPVHSGSSYIATRTHLTFILILTRIKSQESYHTISSNISVIPPSIWRTFLVHALVRKSSQPMIFPRASINTADKLINCFIWIFFSDYWGADIVLEILEIFLCLLTLLSTVLQNPFAILETMTKGIQFVYYKLQELIISENIYCKTRLLYIYMRIV